MITLNNLSFTYRKGAQAISNINAAIEPGVHLLMGENGAGKTTLLHLIAGLLKPSSGNVSIDEYTPIDRSPDLLCDIFLLEEDMHFPARTINEWADVHGCFYPNFSRERLAENLKSFSLTGNENLSSLSLGLEKKSRLAYALSLGVKLLMLDEPTNGIDITARKELRHIIARNIDDNSTVIIATHTVQDFDSLFDSVILLHRSNMLVNMTTWKIGQRLLFHADSLPAYQPLYQEMDGGIYHSISANKTGEESQVNIRLLFHALQSLSRSKILNTLNNDTQQ